jgi:hypothetical protein
MYVCTYVCISMSMYTSACVLVCVRTGVGTSADIVSVEKGLFHKQNKKFVRPSISQRSRFVVDVPKTKARPIQSPSLCLLTDGRSDESCILAAHPLSISIILRFNGILLERQYIYIYIYIIIIICVHVCGERERAMCAYVHIHRSTTNRVHNPTRASHRLKLSLPRNVLVVHSVRTGLGALQS